MPITPAKLTMIDFHKGTVLMDGDLVPFRLTDTGATVTALRGGDLHTVELNFTVTNHLNLTVTESGVLTVNEWLCPYSIEEESLTVYSREVMPYQIFTVGFKVWSENVAIYHANGAVYQSQDA